MVRLALGVGIGFLLSLISVALFSMWLSMDVVTKFWEKNTLKGIVILFEMNFSYDITFQLSKPFNIYLFFAPPLLAWLMVGFVSGAISKGFKRAVTSAFLIVVLNILGWILFSVIAGDDLMALFQGNQLFATLGGIVTAIIGAVIGGGAGGLASGKYEEFY